MAAAETSPETTLDDRQVDSVQNGGEAPTPGPATNQVVSETAKVAIWEGTGQASAAENLERLASAQLVYMTNGLFGLGGDP